MKYSIITSTYHNGTFINYKQGIFYTDIQPTDETIELTWDNLSEFYQKNGLIVSFNIWNCKKGRRVSFFSDRFLPIGDYADVKEWKTKDLNITIKIKFVEIRVDK